MRYRGHLLTLATLLGCSNFTEADAGIVAIEITVPSSMVIEVGQTIQFSARALNQDGETATTEISWRTPDTTVAVESATGALTGVAAGTGRVQAVSGSLASELVAFTVIDATAE